MTPQDGFMVLAPVDPAREDELRRLLESMNSAPGRVDPGNALVPFGSFATLHMARFLLLDDDTTEDVRIHGARPRAYPLQLAFLGDVDGSESEFLTELVQRAAPGLRRLFSCCRGFGPDEDLLEWMKRHRAPATARYVNWRGRSVREVRENARLRAALESELGCRRSALAALPARELHAELRDFVAAECAAGRLALTPAARTPFGWQIRNFLHKIGLPLLGIALMPLLVLVAPFWLLWLRRVQNDDPEICMPADQAHSEALSRLEDHGVSNPFSAIGTLKPGFLRLLTLLGVLTTVDYAARHLVRNGRLGRIRTIHFARWTFVTGRQRMAFFSNYDGSVESYMDDFINKVGFGLNAAFHNAVGYPRTRWLVFEGCQNERKYKEYLRRHTIPTQVWYKAYPDLTAVDLERSHRIRTGLAAASLSDAEARAWAALL